MPEELKYWYGKKCSCGLNMRINSKLPREPFYDLLSDIPDCFVYQNRQVILYDCTMTKIDQECNLVMLNVGCSCGKRHAIKGFEDLKAV